MEAYLTQHKMGIDEHAGVDDTSEVMFVDRDHKWVRKDKLAPDDGTIGVRGDPTQASTELGKMFIEFKECGHADPEPYSSKNRQEMIFNCKTDLSARQAIALISRKSATIDPL